MIIVGLCILVAGCISAIVGFWADALGHDRASDACIAAAFTGFIISLLIAIGGKIGLYG